MGLKFRAESEKSEVSSRVEQQNAPFLSLAHILTMTITVDEATEKTTGQNRGQRRKKVGETLKFARVASSPFAIPPGP